MDFIVAVSPTLGSVLAAEAIAAERRFTDDLFRSIDGSTTNDSAGGE